LFGQGDFAIFFMAAMIENAAYEREMFIERAPFAGL
jgi:hypothetical protein